MNTLILVLTSISGVAGGILGVFYPYLRKGRPKPTLLLLGGGALLLSLMVQSPIQYVITRIVAGNLLILESILLGVTAGVVQESIKLLVLYKRWEHAEWIGFGFGLSEAVLLILLYISVSSIYPGATGMATTNSLLGVLAVGYERFAATLFHVVGATYMAVMAGAGYLLRGFIVVFLLHSIIDSYASYLNLSGHPMLNQWLLILYILIGLFIITLHKSLRGVEEWLKADTSTTGLSQA